jgi:hypothetical protein
MKFTDLIYEIVIDEAKGKDLFSNLIAKWKTQSPKFLALDDTEQLRVGEYIFNFYMKIRTSINMGAPAVVSFLERYDGQHGSTKYGLQNLTDPSQLVPFPQLIEFLSEWGKFYPNADVFDTDEAENTEEKEEELQKIFSQNGPNLTKEKIEESKAMWFNESTALVHKPGFRVYEIMSEEMSKRMGYYYQQVHKAAYLKLRGEGTRISSPWCVTWRGNSFSEYETYDENYVGIGKPVFTHGGNLYGSYRKEGRTFYFVIDESKEKTDRYYMSALQKKGNTYILTSMFNDGDTTKTWDQILGIYPELEDERDKIKDRQLADNELNMNSILNQITEDGGVRDFVRQSRVRRDQYITLGGYIRKPKSWSAMDTELRDKYINTIDLANAYQKVSNEDLLNAMLDSPGIRNMLTRRLSMFSKDLGYIVDKIMEQNYEREYTGKKNNNIIVYRNKHDHSYGVFDLSTNKWLTHGGVTYSCAFKESDSNFIEYTPENSNEGETILIIQYTNPSGQKFYTIQVGVSVSHDDSVAKVYIMSGPQFESLGDMFDTRPQEFSDNDVDLGEEIEKGL